MTFLDKLAAKVSNLCPADENFNPPEIADELVKKIDWKPLNPGGVNFCSHILKKVSPSRVEVKLVVKTMGIIFLFFCFIIFFIFGFAAKVSNQHGIYQFVPVVIGISLGLFFVFFVRKLTVPRVFDLKVGYYWKGKFDPDQEKGKNGREFCRLEDIHAIQLLRERCSSGNSGKTYYSYELNLILKNKRRLNVLDHGNLELIRDDAESLSHFVNVPVWDAIS